MANRQREKKIDRMAKRMREGLVGKFKDNNLDYGTDSLEKMCKTMCAHVYPLNITNEYGDYLQSQIVFLFRLEELTMRKFEMEGLEYPREHMEHGIRAYLQTDSALDIDALKYLYAEPFLRVAVEHKFFDKVERLEDLFRSYSDYEQFFWFIAVVVAENGCKDLLLRLLLTATAFPAHHIPHYYLCNILGEQLVPHSWMHIIWRCLLENNIESKVCSDGRTYPSVEASNSESNSSEHTEIQVNSDVEISPESLAQFVIHLAVTVLRDSDIRGWKLVHYAAARGDVACMRAIVMEKGSSILEELTEDEGCNAAHLAAYHGQTPLLRYIMLEGAGSQSELELLSTKDKRGRTPLHYASEQGYLFAVRLLLENPACKDGVNAVDKHGLIPLHLAACRGNTQVVEELLKTSNGRPRHWTSSQYDLTQQRFSATTILGEIGKNFKNDLYSRLRVGIPAFTHYLSSQNVVGCKPNLLQTEVWSPKGFTALHFAVVYGHNPDTIRKILAYAPYLISIEDSAGLSPLDWAAAVHVQDHTGAPLLTPVERACKEIQEILDAERQKMEAEGSFCDNSRHFKEAQIQSCYQRMKQAEWERTRLQWTANMGNALLYHHWDEVENLTRKGFKLKIKIKQAMWEYLESSIRITAQPTGLFLTYIDLHFTRPRIERMVVDLVKGGAFSDSSPTLRLCLMWAIEKEMVNIVEAIVKLRDDNKCDLLSVPSGSQHEVSPLELATNMGSKNMDLVAVMEGQEEVRRRLYEDRQVNVDYANTILVAAVLIAALAFQGWVQAPQGYKAMPLNEMGRGMRIYDWCISCEFFFSMGALMAGAAGAIPIKSGRIVTFLQKSKRTTTVASLFMAASVACQVVGFASALVSLQSHTNVGRSNIIGMALCTTVGSVLVFVMLVCFLARVHELQPITYLILHGLHDFVQTHLSSALFFRDIILNGGKACWKACIRRLTIELHHFDCAYWIVGSVCNYTKIPLIDDAYTKDDRKASIVERLWNLLILIICTLIKLLLFILLYGYVLRPIIPSRISIPLSPLRTTYRWVCYSFQLLVAPLVFTVHVLLCLLTFVCLVLLPFLIYCVYASPVLLFHFCSSFLDWLCYRLHYELRSQPFKLDHWIEEVDQRANEHISNIFH